MRAISAGFLFFAFFILKGQNDSIVVSTPFEGTVPAYLSWLTAEHNLDLVYSPSILPDDVVTLRTGTYGLTDLLGRLRTNDLDYVIQDDQILIKPSRLIRLSGYVRDRRTGEVLIGASVKLRKGSGTYTNAYGYYSLLCPRGQHFLEVRYVGYTSLQDTLMLSRSSFHTIDIQASRVELEEVTVRSIPSNYHVVNKIPGEINLNYRSKGQIPYFLGEIDVLQEMLLLPGIRSLGEDAGGLNIRGGATDQNLITVDEAPIYNPYHFYGLISVFNPEALNQVKVMKGFVPPSFGGRASSVINIYQRDGNYQSHHLSGGIGPVSARLMAEGPIVKDESSFLVSARQSLLDLSLDATNRDAGRTSFTDLNGKINWRINERNTLFLSGYYGLDRFRTEFDEVRNWGNATMTLRWNRTIRKSWFMHLSGVISDYQYRITNPVESGSFIGKSSIFDYALKWDNEYHIGNSVLEFGLQGIFHKLQPGERLPIDEQNTSTIPVILETEQGIEMAGYFSHELNMNERISMLYGLRYSSLRTLGPKTVYTYSPDRSKDDNTITDTLYYNSGETLSFYQRWEPRISLNIEIARAKAVKLSYSRNNQYIHLLAANAIPSPTDIWKLSDNTIRPLQTDHFSLGYYQSLLDQWNVTIETYYKRLNNLIDYKDGADLLLNVNPETEIISGEGTAYGIEFLLEKQQGSLQGWISYTFSRAIRTFDSNISDEQINNGEPFPDYHDKPHDLSLVVINQFNPRLSGSLSFNFSTGRPLTFPSGKYQFGNTIIAYFEGRNQDRISNYHRLDLSVRLDGRTLKKDGTKRKFRDYWTFAVYNVYARKNAYSYFFRQSSEDPLLGEVVRYSVFGTVLPSITYNFSF